MANSKIYLGNTNIGSLFQGASDISIYLGENKVYPLETPLKFQATYSGGETYSAECDSSTELTSATTMPSGYEYSAMTEAVIGDCVYTIGSGSFKNCSGLTNITISDNVTSINGNAFFRCSGLASIDIPNSVTSIDQEAFRYCSGFTSVGGIGSGASLEIPSGVTNISQSTFSDCKGLVNVTIPDGVTSIGNTAFSFCSSLTSATIGSGVTSIGDRAFNYCNSLTSITVNAVTPPTLGTGAFNNTNNCPIYVPCESVEAYKSASGWSEYESQITCKNRFEAKYSDSTTYYEVCDGNTSLTSASTMPSGYVFSAMTEACIGDCITSIGNGAFSAGSTSSLVKVTVPNSVTSIGERAFYNSRGLKEINIPGGVTRIENYTFYGCRQLSAITIPNTVTRIGNNVFSNCTALSSVTIPDSVTMIGNNVFTYCNSLSEVTIGSGITSIGQDAFSSDRITSLTINATTPPAIDTGTFGSSYTYPIYVPSASVETYKTAYNWTRYASRIQAIPT